MPGLVPGIHVFATGKKDVDGRDRPGHDGEEQQKSVSRARSEEKFSNAFRTLQEIRVLSQPLAHEAIAA